MIVEFSVQNFRSIQELQTISFAATSLNSSSENHQVDENNIFVDADTKILKTIGIYGANASGKSNIIQALEYFSEAISELPSPVSRLSKLAQPFIYQDNYLETESYFQIVITIEGKKYRYGFTVKTNLDDQTESNEIITNEWLFGPKTKNQVKLFIREDLEIDKSNLPNGKDIPTLEYQHTLFLTHAASFHKNICAKIRGTIGGFIASKFSLRSHFYRFHSIRHVQDEVKKKRLLEFLSSFDLKYKDIIYKKDPELEKQNQYPLDRLFVIKDSVNNKYKSVQLNIQQHESEGTKKLFDLAGLLLHAFNIDISGVIILDEIDSNFHPSLLINLIKMFNNPQINKANAQLLFTTHDTNLLRPSLLRRDQFYFTEKDENDTTKLFSLSDLKGIRNDADFAKHYLAGFYGGLPILSQFLNETDIQDEGTLADKNR